MYINQPFITYHIYIYSVLCRIIDDKSFEIIIRHSLIEKFFRLMRRGFILREKKNTENY